MTFPTFNPMRTLSVVAWLLAATATATAAPAPAPALAVQPALAKLDALRLSSESAGDLVYRGDTFAQHTPAGAPLYRYERRVLSAPGGLAASHITRDPAGNVVIVESSVVSPAYEVQLFEVTNQQSGFAGSVRVTNGGRHLEYELNDNGKLSRASEEISDPVICGPSLFGFILKHWDPLRAGTAIPVRMVVIQEKTTYGFNLKFEKLSNGQATFVLTPSNFLIRLAIAPLRVVFDANTRTPVRYEGRVPPKEDVSGKLQDLDARVDYTAVSSSYR